MYILLQKERIFLGSLVFTNLTERKVNTIESLTKFMLGHTKSMPVPMGIVIKPLEK